ncbi:hypothetical protein [Methylobacterium aquaticum]|uniref:hypothetical protein n=1 Tax=Methylobacterium aquaticum TaxID=270351 RepID=UPI001931D556|nr:hypothetical protein [Methylobacterium aquaticum]
MRDLANPFTVLVAATLLGLMIAGAASKRASVPSIVEPNTLNGPVRMLPEIVR